MNGGLQDSMESQKRKWSESWDMLRQLNNKYSLPWICAGYFNELLRSSEKLGGNNKSQS